MQKSFQAIFLSAIKNILFRSEVRSRCLYVVKMVYTFPVGFQGILPLLEPQRLYVAQDIQTLGLHLASVSNPEGESSAEGTVCTGKNETRCSANNGRSKGHGD